MTPKQSLPTYDHCAGRGPTLVFLHYWGGSARLWQPVIDRVPGRETLTIDLRGWSRSRMLPGPYTLQQCADDTVAVVADAQVSDYVLVGHSMGGKIAQLVASLRPAGLRGIVLVGSGPARPPATITPEYRERLARAYDSDETVAWARDQILTATPLSELHRAQVLEDSRSCATAARTEWPLRGIAEDISDRTRMIAVPALVIAGERDQVEPDTVLRDNLLPFLSDSSMLTLPDTGHLMPLEAAEDLSDVINNFVDAL